MVKRIASLRVVSFVFLAVCGVECQNVRHSLPDVPSVRSATQEQRFNRLVEEARSPLQVGTMGGYAKVMRPGGFSDAGQAVFSQSESNTVFRKYLYPSVARPQSGYHSVNNDSLLGRAASAASGALISRNDSGKARLNTSYLLRTLTSVAKDAASTPYWRRSSAQPFSDFGSTVGNDAGMNLWREFGPGIQQLMKNHTPRFVSRITERIGHN